MDLGGEVTYDVMAADLSTSFTKTSNAGDGLARLGSVPEQPNPAPIGLLQSDSDSIADEIYPLDAMPMDASVNMSHKVDWSILKNAQHQQVLILSAQRTAFVSSIIDDYETLFMHLIDLDTVG